MSVDVVVWFISSCACHIMFLGWLTTLIIRNSLTPHTLFLPQDWPLRLLSRPYFFSKLVFVFSSFVITVLFLALSAIIFLFCFCLRVKYLRNGWTDLCQIHREDVFGSSLRRVWMSSVNFKGQRSRRTKDALCSAITPQQWWNGMCSLQMSPCSSGRHHSVAARGGVILVACVLFMFHKKSLALVFFSFLVLCTRLSCYPLSCYPSASQHFNIFPLYHTS